MRVAVDESMGEEDRCHRALGAEGDPDPLGDLRQWSAEERERRPNRRTLNWRPLVGIEPMTSP